MKGYLGGGGFASVNEEHHIHEAQQQTDDASVANMSCDVSSLGGVSALSTDFHGNTGSHHHLASSNKPPSVLVEIPENFPRELDAVRSPQHSPAASRQSPNSILDMDGESVSVATANLVIHKMKQRFQEKAAGKDDSSAMVEIEKNLDDMDNYLLSIYMNDDASIYTKATNSDSSSGGGFSSNSSVSSTYSTRSRHRGAHRNRRRANKQQQSKSKNGNSWIESMKESSQHVFVGDGGWTPMRGWNIAPKKTWDAEPDDRWNEGLSLFDSVKKERLEI